ncbi:MAG: CofH family radical SAM protein [Mucinivorans sp.]
MESFIRSLSLEHALEQIALGVNRGQRMSQAQGLFFLERAPLGLLGALALQKKVEKTGQRVFYNRNIHIEPTNICLFRCRFCSYRAAATDPTAWYYSLKDIEALAQKYVGQPITEVHIVGAVHPDHTLEDYLAMVRTVKRVLPQVVVKSYSAVELNHIILKAGLTLHQGLLRLKEAGMGAMTGGGAEIFDETLRAQICPDKTSSEQWLATHRAAHEIGLRTNATMLYGHAETYAQRVDHLERLRALQDETSGFSAFIPLKYRSQNNSMSALGEVSLPEDMRVLAFSRLYLDNFPHIKAYWPMYGKQATELALGFGADDIDGTIDDTTKIYSMAGAEEQRPTMTTTQMRELIALAGFTPIERDTFYNQV